MGFEKSRGNEKERKGEGKEGRGKSYREKEDRQFSSVAYSFLNIGHYVVDIFPVPVLIRVSSEVEESLGHTIFHLLCL